MLLNNFFFILWKKIKSSVKQLVGTHKKLLIVYIQILGEILHL